MLYLVEPQHAKTCHQECMSEVTFFLYRHSEDGIHPCNNRSPQPCHKRAVQVLILVLVHALGKQGGIWEALDHASGGTWESRTEYNVLLYLTIPWLYLRRYIIINCQVR